MDGVKSVSLLHFLCCLPLFSVGSALSTDKTPVFWPYEDGTVRINSLKFQKVLDSRTKFQHVVWHKCIAKCTSTDQHQWLRIARMNFKGSIFIENFTDSNLYGLDARGILTIKKQTVHNNGTEYRIDICKWGVESEFFKLLHFKDEQAVDGGWSSWSEWTDCSVSCGGGVQNQSRTCTNPPPAFGGKLCPGLHAETRECNGNHCPVDGNWSNWLDWTDCSLTCGARGFQNRSRTCTNPTPEFGGNLCLGPRTETRPCNGNPCPVDGNWSPWYYWSECSTSCGGGVQRRARFCTNPPAAFGGKPCAGESYESRGCNSTPCSDLQKYLHIPWMVGFAVFLVICLLRPLVNIARGIVFIIRQLYTAAPAQAAPAQAAPAQAAPAQDVLAEAQIKASSGGEMREVCDTQGNGRGKTSEHERVPYSVSETNGNSEQTASGHTAAL